MAMTSLSFVSHVRGGLVAVHRDDRSLHRHSSMLGPRGTRARVVDHTRYPQRRAPAGTRAAPGARAGQGISGTVEPPESPLR